MIRVELPIHTIGESNARHHWARRGARVAQHRSVTRMTLCQSVAHVPLTDVVVTLTRIAPRTLDDDNLRGSLKAVRDGVADALGVRDNDPRVAWDYGQAKGKPKTYSVRIEITAR